MWLITILCGVIAGAAIGNYALQNLSKSRFYRLFIGACLGCSLVIVSMTFIASSLTTHWQYVQTIKLQERTSHWDIKYHIVYTSYGDDIFYDFVDETGEEYRISVVDNIVAVYDINNEAIVSIHEAKFNDWAYKWLPPTLLDSTIGPNRTMKYIIGVPPGSIIVDSVLVGP